MYSPAKREWACRLWIRSQDSHIPSPMGFACTPARQAAGALPATARTKGASAAVGTCGQAFLLSRRSPGAAAWGAVPRGCRSCDRGGSPGEVGWLCCGMGALLWRGSPGWALGRVKGVLCAVPAPVPCALISAERQFPGRKDSGAGGAHGGRARAGSQVLLGVCKGQFLI